MHKSFIFSFLLSCLFIQIFNLQHTCVEELNVKNACFLREFDNDQKPIKVYYGGCSNGETCINGFCQSIQNYLLNDDEACKINAECLSEFCSSGKCQSNLGQNGDVCNDSYDCDYLFFCKDDSCVPRAQEGENCGDKMCGVGLACGTGKKCVKKYTQAVGTETVDGAACKSGVSYQLDGPDKMICVNEVLVEDKCNEDDSCSIQFSDGTNTIGNRDHDCTENNSGQKVCKKLSNSKEWNDYVTKYTEKNNKLTKDQYKGIKNVEWLDDNTVLKAYIDYEYGIMIGNKECIRDYYFSLYSNDNEEEEEDSGEEDSGSFYSISKYVFLLFAFLI